MSVGGTRLGGRPRGGSDQDYRLHSGVRLAMVAGGIVLLVLAGAVWWPDSGPTIQYRTQTTVVTTPATAPSVHKNNPPPYRDTGPDPVTTTVITGEIVNGREDQAATAQPAGDPGRRSETIAVTLVAAALLLWLLAAIGRVPSKVGAGAVAVEYRPLSPQEVATLGAKVTERARQRGIEDPTEVGTFMARAYDEAVRAKSRAGVPRGAAWGTELADTYFDQVADEVVAAPGDSNPPAGDANPPAGSG